MTTNYDYFVGIKFQTLLEVRLMINGEKKKIKHSHSYKVIEH